jgi:hypothetical protein
MIAVAAICLRIFLTEELAPCYLWQEVFLIRLGPRRFGNVKGPPIITMSNSIGQ